MSTVAKNYQTHTLDGRRTAALRRDANFTYLPCEDVIQSRLDAQHLDGWETAEIDRFDKFAIDPDSLTEDTPPPAFDWADIHKGDTIRVTFADETVIIGVAARYVKGRWRTPDDHPLGGPESAGIKDVQIAHHTNLQAVPGLIAIVNVVGEEYVRTIQYGGPHRGWIDMHTHETVVGPTDSVDFATFNVIYNPASKTGE